MDNNQLKPSQSTLDKESASDNQVSTWLITGVIIFIVVIALAYFLFSSSSKLKQEAVVKEDTQTEILVPVVNHNPPPEPEIEIIDEPVIKEAEITEVVSLLPELNTSDAWVQEKIAQTTWRKEFLTLFINEDMVRRFVVFTDNFEKGVLAYEHSPFLPPGVRFSAKKNIDTESYQWDEKLAERFANYVALLRSFDNETLIELYIEAKPLIDEAYAELGYPDEDFTNVLRSAIVRVLDMELPQEEIELVRPSVMYRFKDESLENLDDSEKLLLRLGKENLLVIKSILLEINEKLARKSS